LKSEAGAKRCDSAKGTPKSGPVQKGASGLRNERSNWSTLSFSIKGLRAPGSCKRRGKNSEKGEPIRFGFSIENRKKQAARQFGYLLSESQERKAAVKQWEEKQSCPFICGNESTESFEREMSTTGGNAHCPDSKKEGGATLSAGGARDRELLTTVFPGHNGKNGRMIEGNFIPAEEGRRPSGETIPSSSSFISGSKGWGFR